MDALDSAPAPVPYPEPSTESHPTPSGSPSPPSSVRAAVLESPARPRTDRIPPLAWITWSAAVAVYLVAVFNRTSLGVAGPAAEHRFGINAASLSTFTMLQLLVYAGMQIPVGLLVDRFGPRLLLIIGLSVMCLDQAAFAAVDSFAPALLARGLLGCGDAMVFISVLRIVAAWFPGRRVPLITQMTSLIGSAGGVASTWPLTWALRTLGWSGTFLTIALIGACVLVLPIAVVRDTPHGHATAGRAGRGGRGPAGTGAAATAGTVARSTEPVLTQMRAAWSRSQTRLGLWIHFTTGFPGMVVSLLWGYPFLVQGEGLSSGAASGLLTLLVVAGMAFSVVFGILLTHHHELHTPLALGVVAVTVTTLAAVLGWPGRAPLWLLIILILGYATNGGGSMIGFDVARRANPPERLGTASGMVNIGAFSAASISLLATGLLIDRTGAEHAASAAAALTGFKIAFCFPFLLLAVGTVQILRFSRASKKQIDRPGGHPLS